MSIAKKVLKGGIWSGTSKVIQQLTSLFVITILAHLLVPEDFGLLAMITVYIAFVSTFTNLGIGAAIVNKPDASQEQISTIFWLNWIFGFFSCLIINLSTPIAVSFYNEPYLSKLVWLLSLDTLIKPFYITHKRLMERDLKFTLIAKIDTICVVCSSIFCVILALLNFGVYSLIAQSLSLTIFYAILVRMFSEWRPHPVFSFSKIKDMVLYGLKCKGALTANYFERNIDYLILGKILSTSTLGYYAFAYNIMYFPVKRISYVFTELLFPTFSSIKKDHNKIIKGYLKSIQLIALISFPLMAYIAIFSDNIIPTVFGEKWKPVTDFLPILAGAGAFLSIHHLSVWIFPSIEKENIFLYTNFFKLIITASAILIGSIWNLTGVAWGLLIVNFIVLIINQLILKNYLNLDLKKVLTALFGPSLGCCVMYLGYVISDNLLFLGNSTGTILIVQSTFALGGYLISIFLTNSNDIKYILSTLEIDKLFAHQ